MLAASLADCRAECSARATFVTHATSVDAAVGNVPAPEAVSPPPENGAAVIKVCSKLLHIEDINPVL